jgi:small subunit ribosomal protein S2
LVSITMKQLLEAGVHFGHQTKRWNPKMKEYIFGERNGIYIIDLQKSLKLFKGAIQFVFDLGAAGRTVLFLGTKRQAQDAIKEEAERAGLYYVNQRWLGGLLTNFVTIQKSLKRFRELETMRTNGQYELFSKKEVARYERERKKLEKNLSGIKDMAQLPSAVFVIDTKKESIAVQEARKLGIPIIGVADTNADPDEIDYIIPGNDDALRAIRLITSTIAQAYVDGRGVYEVQQRELAEQQAQVAAAQREAQARAAAAAAEARARRQAEGKDTADEGEKPKTTVRKTLQRKAKPKSGAAAVRTEGEPAVDATVPSEHESSEGLPEASSAPTTAAGTPAESEPELATPAASESDLVTQPGGDLESSGRSGS